MENLIMDYGNDTNVTEEKMMIAQELEASLLKMMARQKDLNAIEKQQLSQQKWNASKNRELTYATGIWGDDGELRRMETVSNSDCGSNYGNCDHYGRSFVEENEKRAMYSYRNTEDGNWWRDNGASEESANDNKLCYAFGSKTDQVKGMQQKDDWRTRNGQTGNWRAKEKQVYVEPWKQSERAEVSGWFCDQRKGKKTKETKVSHAEWMAMRRLCDGAKLQQENQKLKAKLWKQVNREKRLRTEHAELKGDLMLRMSEEKELMNEQLEGIKEIKRRIEAIEQKRMTTDQTSLHQMIESLKKELELKTTEAEKQRWEIGVLKEKLRVTPKEEKLKKELQRNRDANSLLKLQIQMCQEEIEQVGKCPKIVLTDFWKPKEMMTKKWGQRVSQSYGQVEDAYVGQITIIDAKKIQCEDKTEKPLLLRFNDDDESQSEENFKIFWRNVIQEEMPKDQASADEAVPKGRAEEMGPKNAIPEEAIKEEKRPGRAAAETGQEKAIPEKKRPEEAATKTNFEEAVLEEKRPEEAATKTNFEEAVLEEKRPEGAAIKTSLEEALLEEKNPEEAAITSLENAVPEEKRPRGVAKEMSLEETVLDKEKHSKRAVTKDQECPKEGLIKKQKGPGLDNADKEKNLVMFNTDAKDEISQKKIPKGDMMEWPLQPEPKLIIENLFDDEKSNEMTKQEKSLKRDMKTEKMFEKLMSCVNPEEGKNEKMCFGNTSNDEKMNFEETKADKKVAIVKKTSDELISSEKAKAGTKMNIGETETDDEENPKEKDAEELSPEDGNKENVNSIEGNAEKIDLKGRNFKEMFLRKGCVDENKCQKDGEPNKTLAGQVIKGKNDEEELRTPVKSDNDDEPDTEEFDELNKTGSDSGTVMDSEDGVTIERGDGQKKHNSNKKKNKKKKKCKKVQKKKKNSREKEKQEETECLENADKKIQKEERNALDDEADEKNERKLKTEFLTILEDSGDLENDDQMTSDKTTTKNEKNCLNNEKLEKENRPELKEESSMYSKMKLKRAVLDHMNAFRALEPWLRKMVNDEKEQLENDLICWRMGAIAANEIQPEWEKNLEKGEIGLWELVGQIQQAPHWERKRLISKTREELAGSGFAKPFEYFRIRRGIFEEEELNQAGVLMDYSGVKYFTDEFLAQESGGVLESVDSFAKVAHYFNCFTRRHYALIEYEDEKRRTPREEW